MKEMSVRLQFCRSALTERAMRENAAVLISVSFSLTAVFILSMSLSSLEIRVPVGEVPKKS